jgi:hypothetical protein
MTLPVIRPYDPAEPANAIIVALGEGQQVFIPADWRPANESENHSSRQS